MPKRPQTTVAMWTTTAKLMRKICALYGRSRQDQMEIWATAEARKLGLIDDLTPADLRQCPDCGGDLVLRAGTGVRACRNAECDYVK